MDCAHRASLRTRSWSLAQTGSFFNLIATKGALDETLAKSYLHQILLALNYLHFVVKVIHRDLKPENVLLTQGCRVVKLCDFGTAVKLCSGRGMKAQGRIGSLSYAAPEVYSSSSSDFASDMWSSGVLLYVMMCAASPFRNAGDTHPEKTAMERVKKGDINKNREKWKTMPSGAKKLLLRLLQLESEDRPSAHEALRMNGLRTLKSLNQILCFQMLMLHRCSCVTPHATKIRGGPGLQWPIRCLNGILVEICLKESILTKTGSLDPLT